MSREIIAVDVDDVLSLSAQGFADFSNNRWGLQLTADDYDEDFAKAWGLPRGDTASLYTEELLNSGVCDTNSPVEDAQPVLTTLACDYDLHVLTSRRSQLQQSTEEWIARHFPNIFQEIHYAGIYDDVSKSTAQQLRQTKTDLLGKLGASCLIDDQPKHCLGAAGADIKALLFGDYRWNREVVDLPAKVERTKTWLDVGKYFNVAS